MTVTLCTGAKVEYDSTTRKYRVIGVTDTNTLFDKVLVDEADLKKK